MDGLSLNSFISEFFYWNLGQNHIWFLFFFSLITCKEPLTRWWGLWEMQKEHRGTLEDERFCQETKMTLQVAGVIAEARGTSGAWNQALTWRPTTEPRLLRGLSRRRCFGKTSSTWSLIFCEPLLCLQAVTNGRMETFLPVLIQSKWTVFKTQLFGSNSVPAQRYVLDDRMWVTGVRDLTVS